jgi:hypothetical protein
MDLMSRVQDFMASQLERLSGELAEKYGVTEEELSDDVATFLRETYGPALEAATAICSREQRCQPELDRFLQDHEELDLVKLDYAKPEGLLYHLIQHEAKGMLPMIAMIFEGGIRKVFTGECLQPEAFERCYRDLRSEGCQNISAL